MTVRPGTYVLAIRLGSDLETKVGSLGTLLFPAGLYCYAGSAMGGLDQRVSRHLRREKTVRWHVDRLTIAAECAEAWVSYPDPVPECELARMAADSGMEPFAGGFGCSDCRCPTHLFRADPDSLARLIRDAGLVSFNLIRIPTRVNHYNVPPSRSGQPPRSGGSFK